MYSYLSIFLLNFREKMQKTYIYFFIIKFHIRFSTISNRYLLYTQYDVLSRMLNKPIFKTKIKKPNKKFNGQVYLSRLVCTIYLLAQPQFLLLSFKYTISHFWKIDYNNILQDY